MAKSLILAIKIIGDASDAIKAMDAAEGRTKAFGDGLNKAAKWSAVGLAAIAGGAMLAVNAASDLEQSTGAVSSVFGKYADEMTGYAEKAAGAVGLSQNQYNESATLLGAQLKNMGISMEDVSGTTNDLIGLGADLAATFGGTTADATAALSSLLRGERDPIEKYGVSIKAADVEAQKLAMGLDGLTGDAAKNADMQATLALLTAQTADAQGQFARETDSAAGSAQIAAAQFENAKAALGEALLPIVTAASEKLAELAKWFQENASWITPLVGVLAGLAAAIIVINAAYQAFAAVQAIQTAAQWASNAAWLASPITWIILAIIAAIAILVTIIVLVVKNWDAIKEAGVAAWDAIIGWVKQAISWLGDKITAPIRSAIEWFDNLKRGAVIVFAQIITKVQEAISWLKDLARNVLPGWASDLLGLNARMVVTPEMAAFNAPAYAAPMSLSPDISTFAAPMPPTANEYAPLAFGNLGAMVGVLAALTVPKVTPQASQTVYNDHRKYEIVLPNYLGEKREVIEEIRAELKKADREDERLITS